jgi:hypothetical protein
VQGLHRARLGAKEAVMSTPEFYIPGDIRVVVDPDMEPGQFRLEQVLPPPHDPEHPCQCPYFEVACPDEITQEDLLCDICREWHRL